MKDTTQRRIHRSAPITAGPQIDHPTRLDLRPPFSYAPDDGQGSGSDGGQQPPPQSPPAGAPPASPISSWIIPDEHRPGLIRRIEEAGSIESAIQTLWRDAYDAREDRRTARAETQAAQAEAERLRQRLAEATTNADGSHTISADDLAALEAYRALGAPAQLREQLDQATQAGQQLAQLQRMETIRQAAQAVGYDPDILADRAGDLEFRIEQTTQDGEPTQLVTVIDPTAGEEATPVPLTDYAAQNWSRYLPVLEATQAQSPGASYPRQRPAPTAGSQPTTIIDQWFASEEQRKASRPNPLLPNKERS